MANDRNSYGSILKAIGLFGGTKVFQIIVGIIKNKLVAILLGPAGMGVVGMLTSTTNLIGSLTGFGLSTSTVRDISAAYNSGNSERIGRVVAILRKLVWATGLLGALITIVFANYLSEFAFGTEDYSTSFRLISVILLFNQLTIGQNALLQGTFHYKYLAKASLLGSVIGLFISVPLYYLWGADAIVPVIIISSLTTFLLAFFYARKIGIPHVTVNFKDIMTDGRTMIVLGAVLAATSAFRLGGEYIKRAFISNYGNIADVGLFIAGSAIVTQYIDVILSSMSTDYMPRLSAVSSDKDVFNEIINRQIKLMVTMILPFIILFIVFARELVVILYSSEFLAIISMIEWMMLSMFFRAISWCLSFSFVAKGESKFFFWNEVVTAIYSLLFSMAGYFFAGFMGLGIAFLLTYLSYTVQLYIFAKRKFDFRFSPDCIKLILKQVLLLVPVFIIIEILEVSYIRYIFGASFFLIICYLTYVEMNKMIPIRNALNGIKNKLIHKSHKNDKD